MKKNSMTPRLVRCAIYTRKSTEEGLEQEFNSLDAQREAAEAYIKSQAHEGWLCLPSGYDDGGFTGGNMERPALARLLTDIRAGTIDAVIVYKVDRLSRSLLDFARMMETFEQHQVSFVSVTQQFNTATSMGRLVLNVLLSFAQFEREIISERTRDKIAAARRKGKWSGGMPLLGYDVDRLSKLVVNEAEAEQVREIFDLYLQHRGLLPVVEELDRRGWVNKRWTTRQGRVRGGGRFTRTTLHLLLTNVTYIGKVRYKKEVHPGEHAAIIDLPVWQWVQDLLKANRCAPPAAAKEFEPLLKGLLRCAACRCAMSPEHTLKKQRRYRYYTCQAAQKRGRSVCPAPSVPAAEIEGFVVEQLRQMAADPQVLAEMHKHAAASDGAVVPEPAEEDQALLGSLAGPMWEGLTAAEQVRLVRLLIEKVEYHGAAGQVAISLRPECLAALAETLGHHEEVIP